MNNKKQFEKYLKESISDRSWYRIKSLAKDNNLLLTKANLEILAKLKTESKKHKLPFSTTLKFFLDSSEINVSISGEQLYFHLKNLTNNKPHRVTILRWFDGYESEKIYSSSEIGRILLHAFIYKLRTSKNATDKTTNRSCALPIKKA